MKRIGKSLAAIALLAGTLFGGSARAEDLVLLTTVLRAVNLPMLVGLRLLERDGIKVDVKDVREMHNLMKYHHASAVKIVACGDYTDDAWKFVTGKPFELIYGETLLAMLSDAQLPINAGVVPFRAPSSPPPMHHRPRTAAQT